MTEVSASFRQLSQASRLTAFGTSLIFVMFCYSGWNAAAYVAGEMKDPQRDLPRSLLAGKVEVGLVASRRLFGEWGVGLITGVICTSILASASAMTIAGPRVYYALGRDHPGFRFLAKISGGTRAPSASLILQGVVTSFLVVSGRVDQIQQYAGFTLVLFASLAVSCVIVLRLREPGLKRPFRAWGYPVTPLLFLGVSAWMMFWAFRGRPVESTLSLITLLAGSLVFFFTRPGKRVVSEK